MVVAAPASFPVTLGAVWMGLAGGGFPDWLDLRSELRGPLRLRHRGASHGLLFAAAMTGIVWLALQAIAAGIEGMPAWAAIDGSTADLWTVAFGAGFLSHLLADACTYGGIQPLLPFSAQKMWLLPRLLRSRSDGYLDRVAMFMGIVTTGFMIVRWVALQSSMV